MRYPSIIGHLPPTLASRSPPPPPATSRDLHTAESAHHPHLSASAPHTQSSFSCSVLLDLRPRTSRPSSLPWNPKYQSLV